MRYAALLRGINVGTSNRVPMAGLRDLVEGLGSTDVRTLLNSGNVVFTFSKTAPRTLAARFEAALAAKLGVHARVVVLTGRELDTVIAENPLLNVATNPSRLLGAIPSDPALLAGLSPLSSQRWGRDALAIGSRAAYLWCADGVIASRLSEAVDRALGQNVTSRNWATLLKLQSMTAG